jgi:hypothetical protein
LIAYNRTGLWRINGADVAIARRFTPDEKLSDNPLHP